MDKMDNDGITDNTDSQNMEVKATVLQKDVSMLLDSCAVEGARM